MSIRAQFGAPDIYSFQRQLRKAEKSPYGRLKSIKDDSEYVLAVIKCLPQLKVAPNLRCGEWYVPKFPGTPGECYFKSTDGHVGQWNFSLKRLNMQLLKYCVEYGGALLVDSTRKGKKFPDSFSRTIPIWACVMNRSIAVRQKRDIDVWGALHMPEWIPEAEQNEVMKRIPQFVDTVLANGSVCKELDLIAEGLTKPICCYWVSRNVSTRVSDVAASIDTSKYTPVVLVSASRVQTDQDTLYVQGAADDHESWSQGLTPKVFWKHEAYLLSDEDGIEERIAEVLKEEREATISALSEVTISNASTSVQLGNTNMLVGADSSEVSNNNVWSRVGAVLNVSSLPYDGLVPPHPSAYLHLLVSEGKQDRLKLSKILPEAIEFISIHLRRGEKVLVHSVTDLNVCICVAVAVFISIFSSGGDLRPEGLTTKSTKEGVKNAYIELARFLNCKPPPRKYFIDLNRYFTMDADQQPKNLLAFREKNQTKIS